PLNTALLWLSAAIAVASIAGYYYFTAYSDLLRVLAMLGGLVLAVLIALLSPSGKSAWEYVRGSRMELRRVVWPDRKETVRATIMVVVFVLILASLIWVLDMILGYAVTLLTGRG